MPGLSFLSKKSFNPANLSNQKSVWEAEQKKAAEDAKIQELAKQIRQEREQEEFYKMAARAGHGAHGGAKLSKRDRGIDWMYQGSAAASELHALDQEKDAEEYLLGKEFNGGGGGGASGVGGGASGDFGQANADAEAGVMDRIVENVASTSNSAQPNHSDGTLMSDPHPEQSNNPTNPTPIDWNETFRLQQEDPMFAVSQKQKEQIDHIEKRKKLVERATGRRIKSNTGSSSSSRGRYEKKHDRKRRRHRREDYDDLDGDGRKDRSRSRRRSRSRERRREKKKKRNSTKDRGNEEDVYYSSDGSELSRGRSSNGRSHKKSTRESRQRRKDKKRQRRPFASRSRSRSKTPDSQSGDSYSVKGHESRKPSKKRRRDRSKSRSRSNGRSREDKSIYSNSSFSQQNESISDYDRKNRRKEDSRSSRRHRNGHGHGRHGKSKKSPGRERHENNVSSSHHKDKCRQMDDNKDDRSNRKHRAKDSRHDRRERKRRSRFKDHDPSPPQEIETVINSKEKNESFRSSPQSKDRDDSDSKPKITYGLQGSSRSNLRTDSLGPDQSLLEKKRQEKEEKKARNYKHRSDVMSGNSGYTSKSKAVTEEERAVALDQMKTDADNRSKHLSEAVEMSKKLKNRSIKLYDDEYTKSIEERRKHKAYGDDDDDEIVDNHQASFLQEMTEKIHGISSNIGKTSNNRR